MESEFIDDDDQIFFGLPEEEDVDFSEVDAIWDRCVSEVEKEGEFEEAEPSTSQTPGAKQKGSKSKKKSLQSRLQCPHCSKTYANERTLKTHLNSVALKDIASRAPSFENLHDEMMDLCVATLLDVAKTLTVGKVALECSSYANKLAVHINQLDSTPLIDLLAESFGGLKFSSFVFLSSLRDLTQSSTNKLINSLEFRRKLKEVCIKMIECPDNILNFFIGNFIMTLSNKVLMYACQQMQNRPVADAGPRKRSNDDFSSLKFQQIVHYIAGSVVTGINRRRRNYPSSVPLKSFASVMNTNFVEDKDNPSTFCDPAVKEWTDVQDRGGLCHVSKDAFNFFINLVPFVLCYEEEDGSVLIDKVKSGVSTQFDLIGMWDVLVGTSIEEDSSWEWLMSVVEIVCRCVSKGIIKRRLNDALQKPTSNIAHRPRLARS